ncbi:LysR family transcriptional regulator [Sphingomonas sanxanigenens]|nr:LysR family transcriptional regulator [Sphingomonas sanxanigenens]
MFQPSLEIRHLRMLQAMAVTGNVTQAATMLGLTQSALSHQIREAQRRLGVDLFVKGNKRMEMTAAARSLNEEAGRILAQLERVETDVANGASDARQIVRIGCGAYSGYRWLPRFMKGFQEQAEDIDIEVVADATRRPINALIERSIDIAVTSGTPSKAATRSLRLFRDELILIIAPDHPLADRGFIVAEDLADQIYISYSDIAEKGHEYDSFLKPAQVSYRKMLKVELTEAIIELVIGGFGVSILSRWAVGPYLRSGALRAAQVTRKGLFVSWHAVTRKSEGTDCPAWRMATALQHWCETDREAFGHNIGLEHHDPI